MKKSVVSSFIKYLLSFFIVLVLIIASFGYWAVGKRLPKDSYLQVHTAKNSEQLVASAKDQIKVVSYNIGHGQGVKENAWDYRDKNITLHQLNLIGETMKAMDADIFLLQEVDVDSNRTHRINQIEYLQEKTQLPYYACSSMWEHNYIPFPYWPINHHIGYVNAANCILSKYPLSNHHRIIFDKPSSNPFWYNWGYIDRGLQRVDVQIGNEKIVLLNIHMEAWEMNARVNQIKIISDYIQNTPQPVILAGDFNTVPFDALKKDDFADDITADYKDEQTFVWFLEKGPANIKVPKFNEHRILPFDRYTFPSNQPDRQLDHMFLFSQKLSFVDFRVVKEAGLASDHLPIMGVIKLH